MNCSKNGFPSAIHPPIRPLASKIGAMLRWGLVLVLLFAGVLAFADTQRLILKDGSYQIVSKYEIKGDIVRYYSAERSQWEEIPNDMIDWEATKKYEAVHPTAEQREAREKAEEEAEAKQNAIDAKEAVTPEVAPNVKLPASGGIFVLDEYESEPQLVPLTQNNIQIDQHTGRNILMHTVSPIIPTTESIEIPKAHAAVQVHVARPVVYVNIDTDEDDTVTNRQNGGLRPNSDAYMYQFVKLGEKHSSRVLSSISTNFAGIESEKRSELRTVGSLTPGGVWIKIQPKQDLPPGEYAVVQILGPYKMNPYVWDFGVNPKAPQNRVTPAPAKTAAENTDSDSKHLKD